MIKCMKFLSFFDTKLKKQLNVCLKIKKVLSRYGKSNYSAVEINKVSTFLPKLVQSAQLSPLLGPAELPWT